MPPKKTKYKKSGRKLPKSKSNTPLMRSVRRRHGYGHAGHGTVHKQKLSSAQLATLAKKGSVTVKLRGGPRKKITKGNKFSDGHIEYYKRSDSKKTAVRRPGSDAKRSAQHMARRKKPMVGD